MKNYTILMKSILSIVYVGDLLQSYLLNVKGNCFRGHGTYEWENGDFYEGMWKAGKPDGNGTFYFENGDNMSVDFRGPKKWPG